MSNEAWTVAVKLNLINQISPGLALISRHFAATHKDAKNLQSELNKIKMLGIVGAGIGGAGFMGLGLIAKTLKPATEYAHQLALMNTSGMKHLEIVKATAAAWEATKTVPTENVMSNLEAIRDLRMVFGNTSYATQYMPIVQQIQGILSSLRHGAPGSSRAESYELAKALEMKGAVRTPAMFAGQADLMTKALVAAGGKVGARDFLSAFKYGRMATAGWGDDFTYKILPTLIQEMKGGGGSATGGPGSALMSAYAAVVGGVVPQKALKLWESIGLLDKSKVVWDKVGSAKGIAPGGILGSAEFQANPYAWTLKFLVPALQKAGYTTEAQQKQALQYLFPNRTAGFVMSQFATQSWKFDRDRKLIEGAQGLGGYQELLKSDPMMARLALEKQWESLLAIMGYRIMPQVISVTLKLMDGIRGLSEWCSKHSTTTKALMWSFTGLSAAMAIGGTVMVLTWAFKSMSMVLPLATAALSGARGLIPLLSGPVGLSAAALAAGYGIGMLINRMLGIEHGELGEWLYDHFHNNNSGKGTGWSAPGKQGASFTVNLVVDGKKMASTVVQHMNNAASQPQSGLSSLDTMMHVPSPSNPF